MDKFVVNIGRQLGSGGREIGEKLARRLGIDFMTKSLSTWLRRRVACAVSFSKRLMRKLRKAWWEAYSGCVSRSLAMVCFRR